MRRPEGPHTAPRTLRLYREGVSRRKSAERSAFVVLSAVVLAACGGGGSGGGAVSSSPPAAAVTGNGLAPANGPGDTQAYFPQAQGDQWSYNFVTNDPKALVSTAVVTAAINGTTTVQGLTATVLTVNDPTTAQGGYSQYFYKSGGGVTLLGNNESGDTITPLVVPYAELLFPVQVGLVSSIVGTNLPAGKDSGGNAITVNVTQKISNVAIETVDVPAGTFINALHQTTLVSATGLDQGVVSPSVVGSDDTWLVPGIGQIKEHTSVGTGAAAVTSDSELRGYSINGVAHGLGTISTALRPGPTPCGYGPPGLPATPNMASDGTNFLAVELVCDSTSGVTVVSWNAVLLRPDGTVLNTIPLDAGTAAPVGSTAGYHGVVAFDGTNYLEVHEDVYGLTSDPNLVAVLISKTGAVVAGPNIVGAVATQPFNDDWEALAFDGNRYLLVYEDANAVVRPPQLSGLFIAPSTAMPDGSPFTISTGNDYTRDGPAVAFGGTSYLVVWNESSTPPTGLRAARVSTSGTLLDASPLLLMDASPLEASGFGPCCELSPSVTFDGTNFLVAYRDLRTTSIVSGKATVSAARVSPAGVLLDGTATVPGIVVTSQTDQFIDRVRSAYINGAHWIVWGYFLVNSSGDGQLPAMLRASRVSTAGVVPSVWPNGFPLVMADSSGATAQWPAITAAASGGAVTWLATPTSGSNTTSVSFLPIYSPGP